MKIREKSKLRIAFITSYPAVDVLPAEQVRAKYCGSEHPVPWVRLLAEKLSEMDDVDLRVFVYGRAVMRHCIAKKNGISFEFVPKRVPARFEPYHMYFSARGDLKPYMDAYKPDIVVGFGTETGNAQAAVSLSFPCIVFVQGIVDKLSPYLGYNFLKAHIGRATEAAALRKADGILVETGFAEQWASEVDSDANICKVPHPLDEIFLKLKPSYIEENILCIGRMYRVKGTDFVLKAFANCRNTSCRLKMIGDGEEQRYTKLARSLGVADRVDFLGRVGSDVVREEMSKARVMVIGSRMDTSPNVITEAHAAGLPVIGTEAGGIAEMINDGEDGYLVPVDDVKTMSDRMATLVSDPLLCKKMGECGKEKVRSLNDASVIAEAHIKFYRKITSNE